LKKYHAVCDELHKLRKQPIAPEPICGDKPYPENYKSEPFKNGEVNFATKEETDKIINDFEQSASNTIDKAKEKFGSESLGKCLGTITVGESVSDGFSNEKDIIYLANQHQYAMDYLDSYGIKKGTPITDRIKMLVVDTDKHLDQKSELEKGYKDRITDLISQNQELRLELAQHKEKLINTQSELDKYRETLKQIHNFIIERGLLSDVSFEDGIKHFPLLISCIFKDNKDMRNSLRQLGVHISAKDNSAFIADSDIQVFTLEEAAEYLEVDKLRECYRMFAYPCRAPCR